jgi:hypothetical protein
MLSPRPNDPSPILANKTPAGFRLPGLRARLPKPINVVDLERAWIDDQVIVPDDDVVKAAILRNDVHDRLGNAVNPHTARNLRSDRMREIRVVGPVQISGRNDVIAALEGRAWFPGSQFALLPHRDEMP